MNRKYFVSFQEIGKDNKVLMCGQIVHVVSRKIKLFKDIRELCELIREFNNCKKDSYIHILNITYLGVGGKADE